MVGEVVLVDSVEIALPQLDASAQSVCNCCVVGVEDVFELDCEVRTKKEVADKFLWDVSCAEAFARLWTLHLHSRPCRTHS